MKQALHPGAAHRYGRIEIVLAGGFPVGLTQEEFYEGNLKNSKRIVV